ncbi:hypothetical protein [Conexibacter arvalis]|uniref:Uncharacterized protein n=1 Tax=Conexibacter arvalis TaxID=912552 RepID=A0A840IDH1_9ACTN|nr:hypothetical protein [Conexibacter arvalis]MBB4662889.1 hypothetical protein [Conexibacter arvalis]
MDVTIGRRERDALWELTFTLLASVGDIFSAVDAGRVIEARELRLRFWDLMGLLDDIGWAVEDPGEEYALTMEPEALMRALLHLQERASVLLREHAEGRGIEPELLRTAAAGCSACGTLLVLLAGEGDPGAPCERVG